MKELFNDKLFRKSLLIATGTILFLGCIFAGCTEAFPFEWLNRLAWVIFIGGIVIWAIISCALIIYGQLLEEQEDE